MCLTYKDELKLNEMFTVQEQLDKQSDLYVKNREKIVQFLLPKIKSDLEKAQWSWHKKYNLDLSDCESLIYESLLTAINTFQISRGNCKFMSFFWTVVSQIFKNYLSKIYAYKRMPRVFGNSMIFSSICSLSNMNQETENTLEETIHENFTYDTYLHYKLLLFQIYNEATSKQKRVLKRLFLGKSYEEIGKSLKMSPSDVCYIVKQLREKYSSLQEDI